jgi:predicted nucleic acid-binding protein
MGKKVENDIIKSRNYPKIRDFIQKNVKIFDCENFREIEILRLLVSTKQLKKGEIDVILLGMRLNRENLKPVLILDEEWARKFADRNLKELVVKTTPMFIRDCYISYNIFGKDETLEIYNLMEKSKFRIRKKVVERFKKEIEEHEKNEYKNS